MSEKPDGGPAFPVWDTSQNVPLPGMTIRDWFAGQALAGLTARSSTVGAPLRSFASDAYKLADAMLDAREARA